MTRDSLSNGYQMPEDYADMIRAIGRIEGMLAGLGRDISGVRADLESMATIQEKAAARVVAMEMRLESLERWQMIHNDRCHELAVRNSKRARTVGTIAGILLVPTIGWMGSILSQLEHIVNVANRFPRK